MHRSTSGDTVINKKIKIAKIAISAIALFLCIALVGGGIGYKLIKHEQSQNEKISNLQSSVALLNAKLTAASDTVEWGDGYNYLAIGNSITKHSIVDYWWQEDGMAASTPDKDYFHLVSAWLETICSEEVTSFCFNGSAWEIQTNDRSEVLSVWDGYLDDELDLVTIQLSENVSDASTFESDFREMVAYIAEKCPNAQIIVIDDFWSDEKSEAKKKVVDDLNADGFEVDWADLGEIRGKSEYQAGMGTTVYDAEGNAHIIEHEGAAKHPGDKGMEYYAEKIEEVITD